MNTPDTDRPLLTAYALGELNPPDAARVRLWLAQSPEALAEYERINYTLAAIQTNAPAIPRRSLNPRQRETVLAMGRSPSREAKVIPFTGTVPRSQGFAASLAKFAAAACVTAGAFFLGQKLAQRPHDEPSLATAQPASKADRAAPKAIVPPSIENHAAALAGTSGANIGGIEPAKALEPAPSTPVVAAAPQDEKPRPQPVETTVPVKPAPPVAVAAAPVSLKAFTLASPKAESVIALQPKLFRGGAQALPAEFGGLVFAAPVRENPLKNGPRTSSVGKQPPPPPSLMIHSWKAEFASCPWDSSRRLMRFVAQIPVNQAGIGSNDRDYALSIKFDPAQVQGWRLIMEKHMTPSGGSNIATRFAWYEIVPTRNFAPGKDKPAALGMLELVQPRGAATEPQQLRLLDRGQSWSDAREDFVFETAMIGFNLLLNGAENVGALNHKLVLEIAEQAKGDDVGGQRTKFINIVKQAQKAAGL